jgi:hypothetical protein
MAKAEWRRVTIVSVTVVSISTPGAPDSGSLANACGPAASRLLVPDVGFLVPDVGFLILCGEPRRCRPICEGPPGEDH